MSYIDKYNQILEEVPNKDDVTLIAVSKTVSPEIVKQAYLEGIRDFGENNVQELIKKMDYMSEYDDINWHLIGRIQTNKVKYFVGRRVLVHSVDRLKLAQEISKESVKKGTTTDIMLQINISEEESKAGFKLDEIKENFENIQKLEGINIVGFMTIAPHTENNAEIRRIFGILKHFNIDISSEKLDNNSSRFKLSMGMSNDYKIAIEEGSNFLRVGTKIFGQRNYN